MKDFKVPAIAGIITFILILIINLFINTVFIAVIRSIISGAVVFGVFFGVIFVFKNYLGIDLSSIAGGTPVKGHNGNTKEKSKVDVTLDDSDPQIDGMDYNVSENDTIKEDNEIPLESEIDLAGRDDDGDIIGSGSDEEILKPIPVDDEAESPKDNDIASAAGGIDFDDLNEGSDEAKEASETDAKYDFDYNTNKEDETDDNKTTIKDKLGIDASYEDLAKAIRTELKRDKQ